MTIIQKYVQYNETFKKPEHGSILVNWHQELKYVHEIYGSPGGALFHLLALDYEQVHAVFQQLIKVVEHLTQSSYPHPPGVHQQFLNAVVLSSDQSQIWHI